MADDHNESGVTSEVRLGSAFHESRRVPSEADVPSSAGDAERSRDDGLLLIDGSGVAAPIDVETLAHANRALPLNQRFARMWEIPDNALDRITLEHELRRAIARHEFEVHVQPQGDVSTNRVIGVEALVRWRHPERGLLLPEDFIPAAEESGLIVSLGAEVLRIACEQGVRRQKRGLRPMRIAVNLSAVQFHEPGLLGTVSAVLKETSLDPGLLELEITETAAMRHAPLAVEVMHELTSLGVTLSLDDFGTGYSSLQYLKEFPIGALKIDESFVRGVTFDTNSSAIVAAVVAIGHSLGLKVIAEGIETGSQLAAIKRHGCDWYQGYLLGAPALPDTFDALHHQEAA